jgi:chromosomal replication initiation ATPase DnaA
MSLDYNPDLEAWNNLGNGNASAVDGRYLSAYRGLVTPPSVISGTIREIQEQTAARHKISFAELVGPGRAKRLFWPRAEAMYIARMRRWEDGTHRWPYTAIALRFGGRDHTTVINAVKRYCARHGLDYPA